MHVRCMLRQDMANAHDWKVRILLFAFLEPTHSIDLSSTYSASWISLLRLNVDLFSTLMTRRRLIRQLASSCSTRGAPRYVLNVDLIGLTLDLWRLIPREAQSRFQTFQSRGRMDLRCMLRQDMANAHDWKVRILLFAFLEPTHSIDLSSTYSASWISLLRLNVDLFSTLMTRRRLIRQLASSCSTRGAPR